jgi:hypothetical protein
MTSQQFLVSDSSTLANFKQWAQAISSFFSTAGWTQTTDTGQVNWSTISSVPAASSFVYEVWKPTDALTAFFVKIEYGNVDSTICPGIRITISTGTDGAGTPNGLVMGPMYTNLSGYTVPSATALYECNFSGDSSRICIMLWRDGVNAGFNQCQQSFCIERSIDSSGSYTSDHVTVVTVGTDGGPCYFNQRSLVFGKGLGFLSGSTNRNSPVGGLVVRGTQIGQNVGTATQGGIPFDTIAPCVGFFDFPLTCCGAAKGADIAEGVPFTVTLYGSTRTYLPTKNSLFNRAFNNNDTTGAYCMRFD